MLRDFKAFQLAKEFHWACKTLRISRFLQDQLLRASSSVALNTAEGSGKRTPQEQRRFYGIALGSLRECEAIIELEKIENPELLTKLDRLGAILFTLCRAPENRPVTGILNRTETETETPNSHGLPDKP
ncbi:MAG: four helix bundle protein [Oligoflexia bacterium]|nr:four helix bundle protein [Oligoflexia bacterium]